MSKHTPGHEPQIDRSTRGTRRMTDRCWRGYEVICSCGWRETVLAVYPTARAAFNAHLRAVGRFPDNNRTADR